MHRLSHCHSHSMYLSLAALDFRLVGGVFGFAFGRSDSILFRLFHLNSSVVPYGLVQEYTQKLYFTRTVHAVLKF